MSVQVSKKRPNSVRSLVFSVILLLVLIMVQPYLWGMVKSRALTLHERRTLTEQIKEVEIKNRDTRNNYESQNVYIDQLTSVIPSSRDALQVIERLETATQGLDVQVDVSRIDEGTSLKSIVDTESGIGNNAKPAQALVPTTEEISKIFPLHITLVAKGSSDALVEYIDAIEHVQELSMIQKFTISPVTIKTSQTPEQDQSQFQLLMTVVFYLQEENDGTEK
jgi:hypothetical protein